MSPLEHPNLVRMLGAVWNEGPDKLCLVLEFVERGSLLNILTATRGDPWVSPGYDLALGIAKCFKYLHHGRPSPASIVYIS